MEILFLSYVHSPFKYHSGGYQRTNLICTALSKIAHVDVLTLDDDKECTISNCALIHIDKYIPRGYTKGIKKRTGWFPPVLRFIIKFFSFFIETTVCVLGKKNKCLAKAVAALRKEKKYDYIFAKYMSDIVTFGIKPGRNVMLDLDDLPEQIFQSKLDFIKNDKSLRASYLKLKFFISVRTSRHYTKKIVKNIPITFMSNERQCGLFNNAVHLPNIPYPFNMALSVPVSGESLNRMNTYQILFIGLIDYYPNFSGLEYFLNYIYPQIVIRNPEAHLKIIGKVSEERKSNWLATYKNISVLGMVDDIAAEYRSSSVVVVPIYTGSGTNIKVLEAMSMGKAVVMSAFASRGYENHLISGKNVLIADGVKDFADKVLSLFESKEYRERIGNVARKSIESYYTFEHFSDIIHKAINVCSDDE